MGNLPSKFANRELAWGVEWATYPRSSQIANLAGGLGGQPTLEVRKLRTWLARGSSTSFMGGPHTPGDYFGYRIGIGLEVSREDGLVIVDLREKREVSYIPDVASVTASAADREVVFRTSTLGGDWLPARTS